MKTLTYIGEATYRGSDPETKQSITVASGAAVKVSDSKAKQLLADYPNAWKEGGKVVDEPKAAAADDSEKETSKSSTSKKKGH
jgi:hypothetical protein